MRFPLRHRNGWTTRRLIAACAVGAASIAITSDAWADIVHIGLRDDESNYIFLVPIIVVWLAWLRRDRMRHCRVRGNWAGPIVVALGWLMYSAGDRFLWQSVWHGGAIVILIGCLLSVVGASVMKELSPAAMAIFFLIPVPGRIREEIAVPLQSITAQITQRIFDVLGVVVQRSGNVLTYNGIDVAIVEACNGLRMVFAVTLVSFAFAFSTPLRTYVRVLIVLASPISAIACNVVRLVPTVFIYGQWSGGAGDAFHNFSAWAMLFLAFAALLGIVRSLQWAMVPVAPYMLAHD